jgi:hypothetical protein
VTARPRAERLLLVLTPAVAMATVAVGLRLGARGDLRAAVVRAAPAADGGNGLAWQILVFDEERGAREPAGGVVLEVLARAGDASATWRGVTNADGVAEALLALPSADGVSLEVRSGGAVLARGAVEPPPAIEERAAGGAGWLRFARREGAVALDVALLGARAAPGFPADLQVRATDAVSHAPLGSSVVSIESDSSLQPAPGMSGTTDARGWVHLVAIPVGLAVTATLHARAPDGRTGEWIGGLYMSPGAPSVTIEPRVQPHAPLRLDVTMPTARSAAYVEIDDARGRAWAVAAALTLRPDGTSHAAVEAPGLAPGLYWAVASADPESNASLGAGTIARPFFVAASDEAALAFGAEREACTPPRDVRETPSALGPCLALSAIVPAPRWTAIDGFVAQRALDRDARSKGFAVALGALAVAVALEALLLLRAAAGGGAGRGIRRARTVALAVLVGLLGFALLAAFIVRV